ncbi:zz type zinc finger domain containing protein [Niveomyces insectorum RCEF 264]|uniref:Zz type zinc finger domain containing protein n=1 Tax=Niveomyces insectorum RCEF 264 TaxID=1081102 RepID=A0A168AG39_9HYPO|nr:zz type zinc finger domain containing protein [Niveomyces insectorum RCEF 264]
MASSMPTPASSETPITLKINHAGMAKKIKLPLRDLVASSLEDKLRDVLFISSSTDCHFERYSDSAGKYIVLDRNNPSVYKQLYRAAKAKQKLKLRVVFPEPAATATTANNTELESEDDVPKAGPRPVTIEEVPESFPVAEPKEPAKPAATKPVIVSSNMARAAAADDDAFFSQFPSIPGHYPYAFPPQLSSFLPDENAYEKDLDEHLQATLKNMARNHELLERDIARLGASVADMGRKSELAAPYKPSSSPAPSSASYNVEAPVDGTNTTANTKTSASEPEPSPALPAAPQPIPVVECTRRAWKNPSPTPSVSEPTKGSTPTNAANGDSRPAPGWSATSAFRRGFSVCCNACERHIPDTHYHCSTCEEGDYDLCEQCVEMGISCYNPDHWLIKRSIKDGAIIKSTTERLPPKPKAPKSAAAAVGPTPIVPGKDDASSEEKAKENKPTATLSGTTGFYHALPGYTSAYTTLPSRSRSSLNAAKTSLAQVLQPTVQYQIRTCNNCIRELPEVEFLHCATCRDFDLCKACFTENEHGHHPKHPFVPAVEGAELPWSVTHRLAAGRGERHNAVCDGCETFITGIRHKCMNCPDWDYCTDCVRNADFIHPDHRFVPIYENLVSGAAGALKSAPQPVHEGIYCDGPHCVSGGRYSAPIIGDRYKCAVCSNKDFCANCEASPANTHNKTHPLIKFRTPVRHVSVTTTGEHDNGQQMPLMGDRRPVFVCSRSAGSSSAAAAANAGIHLNEVQTVVDVKPTTSAPSPAPVATKPEPKQEPEEVPLLAETVVEPTEPVGPTAPSVPAEPAAEELSAMFERDTVADGTILPPNHVFEQSWVLRNTGSVAWPAGCCVSFVSGDYMGHVDPNHPAGIQELVSASESTICYEPLAPGAEFPFTVLLRTPSRLGTAVSYWRLTTRSGVKFGDRLWCDVNVQPKKEEEAPAAKEIASPERAVGKDAAEENASTGCEEPLQAVKGSQMIFPKLEKESPTASIHEPEATSESNQVEVVPAEDQSDFGEWADDDSEDGFQTDEEYDILDASDEEYLEEQQAKVHKK